MAESKRLLRADDEEVACGNVVCGDSRVDEFVEIDLEPPEAVNAALVGLTQAEAVERLAFYGHNEIPKKEVKWYMILLRQFTSSMAIMIMMASVLAAAVQEWDDFAIIATLLAVNTTIGFYEEYEALKKVEGIKSKLAKESNVKREGEFVKRPTRELVPGDVIFLRGGDQVPADCDYLAGDPMQIDTAALTGEPFPRKVPDSKNNRRALGGCVVVAGNSYLLVQRTGMYSEMGTAAMLMQQSTKPTQSVFETKIIEVCEMVMAISLLFIIAVIVVEIERGHDVMDTTSLCLSILIAAVPVALPVVMQVTLALGASEMAKQQAIVTHLTAMQEIASMTILCSDKTGTLTTAKIVVMNDQIWTATGVEPNQIMEWSAVASNPHTEDDPIDVAVLRSFKGHFPDDYDKRIKQYTVEKFVGFNPEVKRTVAYAKQEGVGRVKIAKGLIDKVLVTGDDGGDCWECVNAAEVRAEVEQIDEEMSKNGYKTLGLAFGIENPEGSGQYEMKFGGILPMIDPPRDDTEAVIKDIQENGINVKMITGDHQNIAKETARLIGLGQNILRRDALTEPDPMAKQMLVRNADGFAQVMPKDKFDVVGILQGMGYVVGMTGDGVNDAPALQQAHIGIAVEGSTDAARNAADIILTKEGLSPISTAVQQSRMIFQRVRSYVLYRISATIQIVLVLSLLIFVYDQQIEALYIILLALFNDLTMITISYDNVTPSKSPELPTINKLLRVAVMFGLVMTAESLLFYIIGPKVLSSSFRENDLYTESMLYLQISVSIESLIFITRVPDAPFYSSRPICSLMLSVLAANVIITAICIGGVLGPQITWADAAYTWAYDIIWFVAIDCAKIPLGMCFDRCFPGEVSDAGPGGDEAQDRAATNRPDMQLFCCDIGYKFVEDAASAASAPLQSCSKPEGAQTLSERDFKGVSDDSGGKPDEGAEP